MKITKEEMPVWAHHCQMVTAAHRYCLGRRSYIVGECVDWLLAYWDEFDPHTQRLILKETQGALEKDRAGDSCDIVAWQSLLNAKGEL